ncbi:MAG: deoxyguanosinetriphosphate triphosphohydrolase [Chloroflexi bacterium]|nr:deoxyguanosinetriphosphate triphosphohydrolase [Chloroflexota bacterium]
MGEHRIRLRLEQTEERSLSRYAQLSSKSIGRIRPEEPSFMRTEFMRDRDRIIHSKAFRRLKHKTQVFISPVGDHFVTRLTHTIEVSQIARSISRALRLNEDLTEAIALAHDLGHTPFGHLGEAFLNERVQGGYRHAEQSLRIIDLLEKDGAGLNLTWEVRQGVLHHSKDRSSTDGLAASHAGGTLEAQVCRLSDAIAYVNHDLLDAFRAGVLTEEDVPTDVRRVLGSRHSERLNTIIGDVVDQSWESAGEADPRPEVGSAEGPAIALGDDVREAISELRELLFERVYDPAGSGFAGEEARRTLEVLWDSLNRNPAAIPPGYARTDGPLDRRIADYISGMTDRFAIRMAEALRNDGSPEDLLLAAAGVGAL